MIEKNERSSFLPLFFNPLWGALCSDQTSKLAEGEDYPGIDLNDKVNFNYAGLQLYLRFFF
jgi:hypothetical protein